MAEPIDGITTRAMTDADVPAIIALLERTLGPAPGGVPRAELFSWKHRRGPFGPSIALVAEVDGEVIGLRSFMRWELEAHGESVLAVRAVDTATSQSVQRRGVFSRLTTEALEMCREEGVRLVFNTPNEKSRPGYLKMGWVVVGTWPVRIKVRHPGRVVAAVLRRDLRSGAGSELPTGGKVLPASDPVALSAFDLAASWPEPETLHTRRSAAYLRWRYAEGPITYHVMSVDGALLVFRLRARGRLRELVICEAMAAAGSLPALAELLVEAPSATGADHALAGFDPGWPAAALIPHAGYRRIPKVGVTLAAREITAAGSDPLQRSAWGLTLGDLELF